MLSDIKIKFKQNPKNIRIDSRILQQSDGPGQCGDVDPEESESDGRIAQQPRSIQLNAEKQREGVSFLRVKLTHLR